MIRMIRPRTILTMKMYDANLSEETISKFTQV